MLVLLLRALEGSAVSISAASSLEVSWQMTGMEIDRIDAIIRIFL
jgi:hypothetical protein